jgi:hypothetical protein
MIKVIGPNYPTPTDGIVINTTSRSDNWSKGLSPFFLGPVTLYDSYVSKNVENAWQYSKLYEYYSDDGEPGERYFKWAQEGWANIKAVRYPMGKGAKPLCSIWDGKKYSYIEARSKIYIPIYVTAVKETFAFKKLKEICEAEPLVYLWDFDGYDHKSVNLSYDQVINNPDMKMGHGFVLAMLLEGVIQ